MVRVGSSILFLLLPIATSWCSIWVHSFTTTTSWPTKLSLRWHLAASSKESSPNWDFEDGDENDNVDYYDEDYSSRTRRPRRQTKSSFHSVPREEAFYEDERKDAKVYEDDLPMAPYNGENQKMARYKPRNSFEEDEYYEDEDEENNDDYYFDDDDDEEEEMVEPGGNFWSNPTGGIDRSRQKQRSSSSSPRPTRRRSDISQQGSTSEYGRPRRATR